MKILFDHQAFTNQKYGGISRYFANLHYGLKTTKGATSKLGLLLTHNAYISKDSLPAGSLFEQLVKKQSRRDKYNKWYCRHLLKQGDYDVFHPTYYDPYFLSSVKKPFVVTVHDMIHELYPHYFAKQDPLTAGYKAQVINKADHIIAISECTKRDLQKFYKIPDEKITVVYHGYKMNSDLAPAVQFKRPDKYLLFVGDRAVYKNFEPFINAVAPLLLTHTLQLICSGGGSFTADEHRLLIDNNIADRVQQISASDGELAALYANAEAFVYPSLYEGFGLPVLEAFYNNCPVIMSNTSSLPEVGGDAAQYFDPTSQESMANAIEEVINNKNRQAELRTKGKQRLNLFDFDNTLMQTINVYQQVMR
ncbi:glycosyltransferase family 4 protein [Mucilaginibacter calamicampi]|uniref:Glycosyltransferase family 4 protein n=1 Tax=Mucilaginibacter calamicampi TaxID=1302352 RepID=A0ABW2Z0Y9_9SPHI